MMRILKISIVVFIASVLFASCGQKAKKPATLTRTEVDSLMQQLLQVPLPKDATGVYARNMSFVTTIVDIRFTCSDESLIKFLEQSAVLEDSLQEGEKTVFNTMNRVVWWKPDSLNNIRGSTQDWVKGEWLVSAHVLAGLEIESKNPTVYISITLEHESTAGSAFKEAASAESQDGKE